MGPKAKPSGSKAKKGIERVLRGFKTQPCPDCGMILTKKADTLYHSKRDCEEYRQEKAREAARDAKKAASTPKKKK